MRGTLVAAIRYAALVFAVGFLLGTLRTIFVAPRLGELAAVQIEVPMVLLLSWAICSGLVRRYAVPVTLSARLMMGAAAFLLLMLLEWLVARYGFGRGTGEQLQALATTEGLVGLAAQLGFAAFPAVQMMVSEGRRRGGRGRD